MTVIPPVSGFAVTGPEWSVGTASGAAPAGASSSGGFGQMLAGQIQQLDALQNNAAGQAQALASGTATDASSVVMSVERAQLAMQLASTIRTKAVDAVNELLHTQV